MHYVIFKLHSGIHTIRIPDGILSIVLKYNASIRKKRKEI
jgi:hypothetical protein